MKKASFTLFFLLVSLATIACINEYRTKLDGSTIETMPRSGKVWFKEIDSLQVRLEADQLWELYTETDSIEYLSDHAAKLVYLGEYDKAKQIYLNIEESHPDLYTTASNLGTIYELIGKPDSALFWIRKSIDINPLSHKGSEWIHIKILEFQISESEDYAPSILGLDFGNEIIPKNNNNCDLNQLERDIRHQLHERLQFVSPENKTVGNIYFDLGNVLALYDNLESALESYTEAKRFGFESQLMEDRIEEFESMTRSTALKSETIKFVKKNPEGVAVGLLIGLITFPVVLIWGIRRYKKLKVKKKI